MATGNNTKMNIKVGPGELRWVVINGEGKLNYMGDKPKYEYQAQVVLPKAKAQPFIDQIETFWKEYAGPKARPKSLGFKPELDQDGNETGNIVFNFKTNAVFTYRNGNEKPSVVRVFRANGQEITKQFHDAEKKTANGSEGVIHGVAAIYDRNAAARGVGVWLTAIQFTKFLEYRGAVDVDKLDVEDDGLDAGDGLDVDNRELPAV